MTAVSFVRRRSLRAVALGAFALVVAGCASTSIRDAWFDPGFTGGPFRSIFVLGVLPDEGGERRIFEDIMSEKLRETGIDAVQAYRFLPDGGRAPEAALDAAVARSGADGLLMTRLRGVRTQTEVTTTMMTGPAMGGFGWYSGYTAWFPVQEIRQFDIATVESSLFDVKTRKLVWTAVTETFSPRSVRQEAPGFADVIIRSLTERGLLPRK